MRVRGSVVLARCVHVDLECCQDAFAMLAIFSMWVWDVDSMRAPGSGMLARCMRVGLEFWLYALHAGRGCRKVAYARVWIVCKMDVCVGLGC